MPAELPTERLRRRLGDVSSDVFSDPESDIDTDTDAPRTDDPHDLLPRWLPDAKGQRPGWWETVRADPGRAGTVALAAVAVLAVLVTVFTLIRDEPDPVVAAKLPAVEMVSSGSPRPDDTPAANQPVIVSVVGLVQKPGLVTLTPGARVADALAAAGGVTDGADTIGLNLARHLGDGEQVVVGLAPLPGQRPGLASSVTSDGSGATDGAVATQPGPRAGPSDRAGTLIDLNAATIEQLDTLPGVGPVTAAAIVAWREANGPFGSVEQLGEVDGIGPARLDKLRDLVRV
ncbi:MAG: ComEA family DNA-binding protein [Mycobacterium sp.]